VIILDLEDAVAPDAKEEARARAAELMGEGAFGERQVMVRLNALKQDCGAADAAAVCPLKPAGVVAPKVETGQDVVDIDDALTEAGLDEEAELWAMVETPLALLNLAEIAAAAKATRLKCLMLGLNDLASALGARAAGDRAPFFYAMSRTIAAARAYGLAAIDAVYNNYRDAEGFGIECRQARDFGFDGKSLIHPSQIEPTNLRFSPSPEAVADARAVIEAFAHEDNAGKAVVSVDGRMLERLHLAQAERVAAIAEAIEALEKAQEEAQEKKESD
jgi:citrate lyase subunit beta/citryl-CoA lyase